MTALSSFCSWFSGDSAAVVWATIGGIVVAAGLAIEEIADALNDRFLGGYKVHGKMRLVGWWTLMFGIWIEVADAGWTAHEINKANPINQNISALSASAYFDVAGKDVPDLVVSNRWPPTALLMIGNSNAPLVSILPELQSSAYLHC